MAFLAGIARLQTGPPPPEFIIPALTVGFLMVSGVALAARRLIGLRGSPVRTLLCAFVGLSVGGFAVGARLDEPAMRWGLLPVMFGVALAVTMVALLVVDALLPGGGPVGWLRLLSRRFARARRYAQVSSLATRHGLVRYVRGRPSRNSPQRNAAFARALRATLEDAGVTFVKLGQLLSTRRDLLPPEFIDELSKLQNEVPPAPYDQVVAQLTAELGAPVEEVFASFEHEPLAAASIAQVHRATLRSGERVVVKIRRPGIVTVVERDLDIVRRIARSLDRRFGWARGIGVRDLADGFADALREELDFRVEARNLTTVAAASAQHADNQVRIPAFHRELTTAKVLIMECVDGVPLGRAHRLMAERGIDRDAVAHTLLFALLRQVMTDGVFHADPHPGNILIQDDGRLALLDFGSVGRLDIQMQASLRRMLSAIDRRDPAGLRDAFTEIMDRSDDVDGEALERSLGRFMARHLGPGLTPDIEMFTDLFRIVSTHGIAVPAEVAAVFRALATVEGTLAHLAPGFNIVRASRTFAEAEISTQFSPRSLKQTATDELLTLLPVLRRLPRRADRISTALERGRLTFNIRLFSHEDDQRIVSGLLHRAMVCVLAATTGIMAVLLLTGEGGPLVTESLRLYEVFGYNLFVLSTVLMLKVVFGRDGRHRRDPGRSR